MSIEYCPDCSRYHETGLWQCPTQEPAEIQSPLPPSDRDPAREPGELIPRARRMSLPESLDKWTSIYEKHLNEFASETDGVPTVAHVRRAEQLADREIRSIYAQ